MTPIQDLLSQIRWDESFGKGNFVIGYYDRKSEEIIQIPLQQVQLTQGDHFFFRFTDQEGLPVKFLSTVSGKCTGTAS